MIDLLILLSFTFILASLFLVKHRLGSLLVTVGIIFFVAPLMIKVPASIAVGTLMLFVCFEVAAIKEDLWNLNSFKEINSPRFRLGLIAVSLTLGVSVSIWWWRSIELETMSLNMEELDWWKLFLVLPLALYMLTLEKNIKRKIMSIKND